MINVRSTILVAAAEIAPADTSTWGKWVFVAAMALLVLWLVVMPRRLIGQEHQVPPWWRNVRVWAIVVALVQMGVYLYFG